MLYSRAFKFFNFFLFSLIFFLLFGFQNQVQAADPNLPIRDSGYVAKYVSQDIPDPIEIPAGTSKTVTIKFKNTGSMIWRAGGNRFISAYTVDPKYHNSLFRGLNWIGSDQTATISTDVYPGQTGELKINLIAPNTTGSYVERFYLAAENYTWVAGSYFYLKINVTKAPQIIQDDAKPVEAVETPEVVLTTYKANRFILSIDGEEVTGGQQIKVIAGYQNIGESSWQKYSIVSGGTTVAGVSKELFTNEDWVNANTVIEKNTPVSMGEIVRETFYIRAPAKKGEYTVRLNLKADDTVLGDGAIEVPLTVVADAPAGYVAPQLDEALDIPETYRLNKEPRIRVGLWKDANIVEFISEEYDYNVFNGLSLVGVVPKGVLVKLSYSGGTYFLSGASISLKTTNYIRLEPTTNQHAVFTLRNLDRQVFWKGARNFNKYRGVAEYRVTKDGSSIYLINDVLLEDYVAGIGETTGSDPIEYIKALLTAARTYAYYIQQYSNKHDERNFDVVAHTGDQLYLGYLHETLTPRVVEAEKATRGAIITFNNDVVITPYFGNTDGRTRSWTEVWGGAEKPWLVSVKADYDLRDGKTLFGHGVGMSQRDATKRADEGGATWLEIIKHYYTGVNVENFYK